MSATSPESRAGFASLHALGRQIELEYEWIHPERVDAPLVVFLHEGLGSIAMWRDWPRQACDALGCRGLVYSRYGYGRSTPRPHDELWSPRYLHDQAHEALPALLRALGVDARRDRPVLFGHSDGGSIALLYAARYPDAVAGIAVAAPHIFVEDVTIAGIRAAREAWERTDLRARLGRYHADPVSAFFGWNDGWLAPAFRDWNIEAETARIRCPVLAIQGEDDEYATLAQIRGIARLAPRTELLVLPDCGHSPHKDEPQRLIQALDAFVRGLAAATA